MTQVTILISLD